MYNKAGRIGCVKRASNSIFGRMLVDNIANAIMLLRSITHHHHIDIMLPAVLHMQIYSTAGISMCHWILRSHFWTHRGRQQYQRGNPKEHLWFLLCASATVSLGAHAAVAGHHARSLLSWSPLRCTGELASCLELHMYVASLTTLQGAIFIFCACGK